MSAKRAEVIGVPFSSTDSCMSSAHGFDAKRYGSGVGSCDGASTRWDRSASSVTTHGEMLVAKLLARLGPSGWYSKLWISRADQSLSRTTPNTWSSAASAA